MASMHDIISNQNLSRRIFFHLSFKDILNCATVSKIWSIAVEDAKLRRTLVVTPETEKLKQIIEKFQFATSIDIYGWSGSKHVPSKVYDRLTRSQMYATRLTLRGRGVWETCRCPKQVSSCGEQFGTFTKEEITNLESIHISTTFSISACALIDLVSRSPRLKALHCYGAVNNSDHNEMFESKRFLSNIVKINWPWALKKHLPTLRTIVRRNENIETFYSDAGATFGLLSSELLPNLRYLSLNLNENWSCKPGRYKRLEKYIQNVRYIAIAKKVEALEIRTFVSTEGEDQETSQDVERLYENYKLEFWKQLANLPNLSFLGIYGAWEFEKTCRALAKHNIQIEFLKINLTPISVITSLDAEEDAFSLSMADGVRYLKKLPRLKSLHLVSYEKFASIDIKTTSALKELMDIFWILDIKTCFTDEVEDLLNNIMRRGNQLGKTYKMLLHVQSKDDCYVNLLREERLKFPLGTNLREKLTSIALDEATDKYGKPNVENFQLWGLELIHSKDAQNFNSLKSSWQFYNEKFYQDSRHI